MKSALVNRLIRQGITTGSVSLEELDQVLADDSTFDANVDKLNLHAESFIVSLPADWTSERGTIGVPINPPPYSAGQNLYLQYVKEIRQSPRMEREEEYAYSKRMEFFKRRLFKIVQDREDTETVAVYFIRNIGCPSRSESAELCPVCAEKGECPRGKKDLIRANCLAYTMCRSIFVERNLNLVVNFVYAYKNYGMPIMDLIQEGNMGLLHAVERYDWRKGVRFQTYAEYWIRQAVERFISATKGIVRLPNHVQQQIRRMKREGRLPDETQLFTAREVSEIFDMSQSQAGRLIGAKRSPVSLSSGSLEEMAQHSNAQDTKTPSKFIPREEMEVLKKSLNEAMEELTEKERLILKHRFGLEDADFKTLNELGEMMNVSRERIWQTQNRALEKLKNRGIIKKLKGFFS